VIFFLFLQNGELMMGAENENRNGTIMLTGNGELVYNKDYLISIVLVV
jgi:hypothetical protein